MPIQLGLIGCGGIVQRTHAPAFRELSQLIEIVAVADPIEANRQKVASIFQIPDQNQYSNFEDLLNRAPINAVSIATPHFTHVDQVVKSAFTKKSIISEKPMATSLEEADQILEAIDQNGVAYSVVHNLIFSSAMREAQRQIRSGEIGKQIFGRSQAMFLKPPNLDLDNWRHQKKSGGGCIIDTAYHEIYAVEALIGSPIRFVEARVQNLNYKNIDVDDHAVLLCEHENGVTSTVTASWCAPTPRGNESGRWCEVHTTNGSIRVNHRLKDPMITFSRSNGWQNFDLADLDESDPTGHKNYFRSTFDAIANGKTPPITGEHARHNLAIISAARRATIERHAIDLNEELKI